MKARIALDAIKGQKPTAELASEYGVHANQISTWKKQLLEAAPSAFTRGKDNDAEKKEIERNRLFQKVGQLQIEVDWLKKRQAIWDDRGRRSSLYSSKNPKLSTNRQCELLHLLRSSTTGLGLPALRVLKI